MNKKAHLILIILFSLVTGFIFSSEIEDLINKSDEDILQELRDVNFKYSTKGYNSELVKLNNKALDIAEQKGDSLNAGRALYTLASMKQYRREFKESEDLYLKALSKFQYTENTINLIITYNTLFSLYDRQNRKKESDDTIAKIKELLPQVKNQSEIIRSLDNISLYYKHRKEYDKAVEYQIKTAEKSKEFSRKHDIAGSYMSLGSIYLDSGDYDKSWDNYQVALEMLPEAQDSLFSAYLYNNVSSLFSKQKKYNIAFEYALKSIKIKEALGQDLSLAKSFQNLSALYFFAGKYELACQTSLKGIALADSLGDVKTLVGCYANLAPSYNKIDSLDAALTTYEKLIELCEANNLISTKHSAYSNIAIVYQKMGDYDKSIKYSKMGLKRPNASDRFKSRNYINLATSYQLKKEYQVAYNYASMANQIAYKYDIKEYIKKTNDIIADCLYNLNKPKQAYDSLLVYSKLLVTTSEEDKKNSLEELRIKYDTEKKDSKIKNLQYQKEVSDLKINELNYKTELADLKINELNYQKRLLQYQRISAIVIIIIIILIFLQRIMNHRRIIRIKEDLNKELEGKVKEGVAIRMEQQRAIVEQSRLVSLGELAAGIAHELNQPLQCISFALENMKLFFQKRGYSEDFFNERMELVSHDISRMTSVVDHIRVFSRKQRQKEYSVFELNETVKNALKLIAEQYYNHSIDLIINVPESETYIYGNTYEIEQVLLNLLSNAKDSLEHIKKDKYIKINISNKDDICTIKVTNNGDPIPQEIRDKIFLPFFTTKPAGKGTGLGLSIVYGIISEHNGTINVEDEDVTTFKIILPIYTEESDNEL